MEFLINSAKARREAALYVMALTHEPLMVVKVKPYKETRSSEANRYYWGLLLKSISSHTGDDVDSLHEFFKAKFIGQKESMILGEKISFVPSTTKLTKEDFAKYVDQIVFFAAQHGINIDDTP